MLLPRLFLSFPREPDPAPFPLFFREVSGDAPPDVSSSWSPIDPGPPCFGLFRLLILHLFFFAILLSRRRPGFQALFPAGKVVPNPYSPFERFYAVPFLFGPYLISTSGRSNLPFFVLFGSRVPARGPLCAGGKPLLTGPFVYAQFFSFVHGGPNAPFRFFATGRRSLVSFYNGTLLYTSYVYSPTACLLSSEAVRYSAVLLLFPSCKSFFSFHRG